MRIGRIAAIGAGGLVAVLGARKLKQSRSARSPDAGFLVPPAAEEVDELSPTLEPVPESA